MKRRTGRTPRRSGAGLTAALLAAAAGLGLLLAWIGFPSPTIRIVSNVPVLPVSSALQFEKVSIGGRKSAVRITNVQIVDFDRDGRNDILVCDAAANSVFWYRQNSSGQFDERILGEDLKCPAHATVVDLDQDGDLDVVVAVLGSIFPFDELVGKVVFLENERGQFIQRVLLDDVRRVADVQAGDLNGDGKLDLAVAVFGYARGEVLWLENLGQGRFRDHQLLDRPGTIHVPIGDLDGDGDLDIATVASQDEEEVWALENLGSGDFRARRLFWTPNYDAGSAGLVICDLDADGRLDLLLPQGDNLEDPYAWPQPYHGCLWLQNLGQWNFQSRSIGQFGGTYAAAASDLDQDGDSDVVLVSLANDWNDARHPSIVWLQNNGRQDFKMWKIDSAPVGLVTVAAGDLNGDGRADIVAGSLSLPPLVERRVERLTVWINREGAQ